MIYSKQRDLILKTLHENRVHPTADEIYRILKPAHPALALATVYRNLNQLSRNGMAQKISVPDGSDRFDGTLTKHYHMVCESCGRVTDIPEEYVPKLNEEALRGTGVSVRRSNIMFYGTCAACMKAEEQL